MSELTSHNTSTTFHLFTQFPLEIRTRIWQLATTRHIVRWVRIDDNATPWSNRFPYSRRRDAVYQVSREARDAIILNAKFVQTSGDQRHRYSPTIDFLHLDPAWRELRKPQFPTDPFRSLCFDFRMIRRIMINPNYTDERMKPGLALERLPLLEEILIVADEKSVGLKDKFMLASVYDLQKYFQTAKHRDPTVKIPYIAVGCLGWIGDERLLMSHSSEDRRQLIAVFESHAEMKAHLGKMREQETSFVKRTFHREKGFKLNFKPGFSMEGPIERPLNVKDKDCEMVLEDQANNFGGSSDTRNDEAPPPSLINDSEIVSASSSLQLQPLSTSGQPNGDELPTFEQSQASEGFI